MGAPADQDVTRRTRLAAERTWLAWWRTGIAAAGVAVALGGLLPQLVDERRTPFIVLGTGCAALAVGLFVAAGLRQVRVDRALQRGEYPPLGAALVVGFSVAGVLIAVGTLGVVLMQL